MSRIFIRHSGGHNEAGIAFRNWSAGIAPSEKWKQLMRVAF